MRLWVVERECFDASDTFRRFPHRSFSTRETARKWCRHWNHIHRPYRNYRVVEYVPKPAQDACGKREDATEGEA